MLLLITPPVTGAGGSSLEAGSLVVEGSVVEVELLVSPPLLVEVVDVGSVVVVVALGVGSVVDVDGC